MAIEPIEAKESFEAIKVSSYSEMKKNKRSEYVSELKKKMTRNIEDSNTKRVSTRELAQQLAGMMSGG